MLLRTVTPPESRAADYTYLRVPTLRDAPAEMWAALIFFARVLAAATLSLAACGHGRRQHVKERPGFLL